MPQNLLRTGYIKVNRNTTSANYFYYVNYNIELLSQDVSTKVSHCRLDYELDFGFSEGTTPSTMPYSIYSNLSNYETYGVVFYCDLNGNTTRKAFKTFKSGAGITVDPIGGLYFSGVDGGFGSIDFDVQHDEEGNADAIVRFSFGTPADSSSKTWYSKAPKRHYYPGPTNDDYLTIQLPQIVSDKYLYVNTTDGVKRGTVHVMTNEGIKKATSLYVLDVDNVIKESA